MVREEGLRYDNHVLKTISRHCRDTEIFKQERSGILAFLERLFCGGMLEETGSETG